MSPLVTWGLLAAWVVHDAEELAMMPGWAARARPRLQRRLPWVPSTVWDRAEAGRTHTTLAIGLMGLLIAAAAADGARTDGRSAFFQSVLTAFGLHAGPHVVSALVTGGYTPGLVTAPSVVLPFWWWAKRSLRAAGVPQVATPAAALPLIPLSIAAAHLGAAALLRLRRPR